MVKNIIYAAIALLLAVGIWYWWNQHQQMAAIDDGSVVSRDSSVTSKSRMDSGAVDLDGRAQDASVDPASGLYTATPATKSSSVVAPVTTPTTAGGNMPAQSPAPAAPTAVNANYSTGSRPSHDTLTANAPDGMAFGGSGKFQWYRQGNITWRINTQSGSTCIAFATMDEWAKPIVYTHGCGNA